MKTRKLIFPLAGKGSLYEIRIGRASALLAESDNTIADICYSCGFESLTYFNRVFLKKKGIPPREFRVGN